MLTVWDILYARRPVLNYVCPGICEVIFSGSSSPVIILSNRRIGQVTGLVLGGVGGFQLSWNAFPGAICYNVYFIGGDDIAVILAQCITDTTFELPPGLGPGDIIITPITPDGEGEPSDPIAYPSGGGGGCLPQTGAPAPDGADAFSIPVDEMTLEPIAIEREVILFFPIIPIFRETPPEPIGAVSLFRQEFLIDAPPGRYDFGYISGFFNDPDPTLPPVRAGNTVVQWGMDTDHPGGIYDAGGNLIGYDPLVNQIYTAGPPPGATIPASGLSTSGPSYDNVEAQFQVFWNTPGAEKRWKNAADHGNDGGLISAVLETATIPNPVSQEPGYEQYISLVQISGLIQQPRKVRIAAWNVIKSNFPAAIRDNWDGTFPIRTVYTETTLTYTAAAAGAFPGATCFYTQSHPTAPNGCGWVVQVGAYWTGLLEVGNQPTGIYIQSGIAPPVCVEIEEYE